MANSLICLAQYKVYIMVYDFRDFLFQPNFKPEVTWGFLYPLIRDLREAHRRVAPTTLINALLFTVVTCLVLKVWWRRTGRKFWWDTQNVFFWDQPFLFGWVCWVFSCSVGLNPFSVGFTLLINFFNRPQTIYPGYQRFFSRCSAEYTSGEKNYEEVEKALILFFRGLLPGATVYQPKTSGKVSMKKPAWTVSPETGWESCLDPMHLVTRRGREGVFFFGKLFDDSSYTHYDINCRRNRAVNSYVSSLNSLNIINPFSPSALFP